MNSLTDSEALTLRTLKREPTNSEALPYGLSSVSLRTLKRGTLRTLKRRLTLQIPPKVGLSGWTKEKHRRSSSDFAGSTSRTDKQASTRLRRGTSVRADHRLSQRLKGSSGLRAESKDKSKTNTNTNTGMVLWRCL